jgi:hypothetical protein
MLFQRLHDEPRFKLIEDHIDPPRGALFLAEALATT